MLTPETECKVIDMLTRLGITADLVGFQYIVTALGYIIKPDAKSAADYNYLPMKHIHVDLEKKYGVCEGTLSKSIRYAIMTSTRYGDRDYIRKLFGDVDFTRDTYISNAKFLYTLAVNVNRDLD